MNTALAQLRAKTDRDLAVLIRRETQRAMWLAARGLRGRPRDFVLAGLLAGVATLSRNDGVLVLAVLLAVVAWDRIRTRRASGGHPARPARIPFAAAAGAVALFLLAVGLRFPAAQPLSRETRRVLALDVVELHPDRDIRNRTAELARDVILAVVRARVRSRVAPFAAAGAAMAAPLV